ncbi:MAG TPA: C39 family peptidase [Myxococcales bacterium]|nr:C39 family peptidase [Myxococcales bacterium]
MANPIATAPQLGTQAYNLAEDRTKKQFNSSLDRLSKHHDASLKTLEERQLQEKLGFEARQKQTLEGLNGPAKEAAGQRLEAEKLAMEARHKGELEGLKTGNKGTEVQLESGFKTAEERMKQGQLPTAQELKALGGPAGQPLPFIHQLDPAERPSQYRGDANCGPAVMAMLGRARGYRNDISDAQLVQHLARVGGTTDQGTSGNGLIAMGQEMGLTGRAAAGADLRFINGELAQGKPVVALGDYYALPPHTDPAQDSGHYLLIHSQDELGNYRVSDPAEEKVLVLSPETLAGFIRANPAGGFALSFQ